MYLSALIFRYILETLIAFFLSRYTQTTHTYMSVNSSLDKVKQVERRDDNIETTRPILDTQRSTMTE